MEDTLKERHEQRRLDYLRNVDQRKGEDLAEIEKQRQIKRKDDEERIRKKMEDERLVNSFILFSHTC